MIRGLRLKREAKRFGRSSNRKITAKTKRKENPIKRSKNQNQKQNLRSKKYLLANNLPQANQKIQIPTLKWKIDVIAYLLLYLLLNWNLAYL